MSVLCMYIVCIVMSLYIHDMYMCVACMYMLYTCTYLSKLALDRYLGLFGDHIVPAVLYSYTQVLLREDLVSSKGKPLLTTARLEAVWKRLADRFATVWLTPQ